MERAYADKAREILQIAISDFIDGSGDYARAGKQVVKYTIDNSWFFVPVDRAKEARRVARKARPVIGVTKKISDRRRKPPKHRKPLREED